MKRVEGSTQIQTEHLWRCRHLADTISPKLPPNLVAAGVEPGNGWAGSLSEVIHKQLPLLGHTMLCLTTKHRLYPPSFPRVKHHPVHGAMKPEFHGCPFTLCSTSELHPNTPAPVSYTLAPWIIYLPISASIQNFLVSDICLHGFLPPFSFLVVVTFSSQGLSG